MKDIHFDASYSWLCSEISSIPFSTQEYMCKCIASLKSNTITIGYPYWEQEVYPLTDEEYFRIERLANEGSMDGTLF